MPDCDENMALRYVMLWHVERNQGTSTTSDVISLAHKHHEYLINGLASVVIR